MCLMFLQGWRKHLFYIFSGHSYFLSSSLIHLHMVTHIIHKFLIHDIKLFLILNTCHWCILELNIVDLQIKIVFLHHKGCR